MNCYLFYLNILPMDTLSLSKISNDIKQYVMQLASYSIFNENIAITYLDIFVVFSLCMILVFIVNLLRLTRVCESTRTEVAFISYFTGCLALFFTFAINYILVTANGETVSQQIALLKVASVFSLALMLVLILLNSISKAFVFNKLSWLDLISLTCLSSGFTLAHLFEIFEGYDNLILIMLESIVSMIILYYMFITRNFYEISTNIVFFAENNIYTGLVTNKTQLKDSESNSLSSTEESYTTESTSDSSRSTSTSSSSLFFEKDNNQQVQNTLSAGEVYSRYLKSQAVVVDEISSVVSSDVSSIESNKDQIDSLNYTSVIESSYESASVPTESSISEVSSIVTETEEMSNLSPVESSVSEVSSVNSESEQVSSYKPIDSSVSEVSSVNSEYLSESSLLPTESTEVSSESISEQTSKPSESTTENTDISTSSCSISNSEDSFFSQLSNIRTQPTLMVKKSTSLKE